MRYTANKILKHLMPRGLFVRSLLILITPIVLILSITSIVFIDNHWNRVSDRFAETVIGEVMWLSDMVESSRWEYTDIAAYGYTHLEIGLEYIDGATLPPPYKDHGSWERIIRKSLTRALEKKSLRDYRIDISNYKEAIYIKIQLENGVLEFEIPARRVFSSSTYIFLIWMVVSAILFMAIAAIFMRNQIRPIRALAKATEDYGKGIEPDDSFKPYGAREVRQAARAFLEMKARISKQVSQRTVMLAGVSHDLRTPLTRLKLGLSMLPASDDIADMKQDITDMEKMIDGYLNFARGADIEEKSEEHDLSAWIPSICDKYKSTLNPIHLDIADDLNIRIRANALERAFMNIINNAHKYGSEIWVTASKVDIPYTPYIEIHIEDNGSGIDEEKWEDVFKPFYRVDASRNTQTGGVGLGLSIAQDIILSHGGKINLENSAHGGLSVCIHLPL